MRRVAGRVAALTALHLQSRTGSFAGNLVKPESRMKRSFTLSLLIPIALACLVSGAPVARAQDANAVITEGDIRFRDGAYEAANQTYTRALGIAPNNVRALNNRGLALARLGRINDAHADLSRALELEARNGDLWNNRANVNCAMGRYGESFQDRLMAPLQWALHAGAGADDAEAVGVLSRTCG